MSKDATLPESAPGEERFPFGQNWTRFLDRVDEPRIEEAEKSLSAMLGAGDLHGKSFLDVGCGSGLFSLSARRLGARVHSFDFDVASVACTQEIRRRYFPDDLGWAVEPGSTLDEDYLNQLGTFDVVYAWGVLHHTGSMWKAIDLVAARVAPGGKLFLSIYNDQGRRSRRWTRIKRAYNRFPRAFRFIFLVPAFVRFWGPTMVRDLAQGRPFHSWRNYSRNRGMSAWHDLVDWVGGYPFEVARPERVFDFLRERGLSLVRLKTCGGGIGCNEFVFDKPSE
jgi:2-polyprenyl-3-methyl-5-hydroxy-6-metoxy-1,4-benzoquinol methylase